MRNRKGFAVELKYSGLDRTLSCIQENSAGKLYVFQRMVKVAIKGGKVTVNYIDDNSKNFYLVEFWKLWNAKLHSAEAKQQVSSCEESKDLVFFLLSVRMSPFPSPTLPIYPRVSFHQEPKRHRLLKNGLFLSVSFFF